MLNLNFVITSFFFDCLLRFQIWIQNLLILLYVLWLIFHNLKPKNNFIFNELILNFILKTHGRNILSNIIYCLMFKKTNYKKSSVSKHIKWKK